MTGHEEKHERRKMEVRRRRIKEREEKRPEELECVRERRSGIGGIEKDIGKTLVKAG